MLPTGRSAVCSGCLVHLNRALSNRPNNLSILSQLGNRRYNSDKKADRPARTPRPFRVAVIGSGPAGFYAAHKMMRRTRDAHVDMYEQLPVPFGLVRYGVAPDHPEVKNCQDLFTEVANSPRFNFIGNVDIGSSLPLSLLKPHYDAILFSYGASKDRELGIPNENELKGIYSARAFVGWYNGLPEYQDLAPDLTTGEDAVIIGQGNVALDVARALLMDVDVLRKTDMTEYALEALSKSRIKRVRIVGRRGPMQAAFSNKELRELVRLPSVGFESKPSLSLLPPKNLRSQYPRIKKRLMEICVKGTLTDLKTASKMWSLNYLLSPNSFHSSPDNPGQLSHITFTRNQLDPSSPFTPDSKASPLLGDDGNAVKVTGRASHCFRSIGYQSCPLPGFDDLNIPFDTRQGLIPNDGQGRIIHTIPTSSAGFEQSYDEMPIASHLPGLYCAGWVKRGPTGVIASTMEDAFATGDAVVNDWHNREHRDTSPPFLNTAEGGSTGLGWDGVRPEAEKLGLRPTNWRDWEHIDSIEKERGKAKGKVREKIHRVEDMLDALP